ncbi:MAG: hypothetical protein KTR13_05940 [Saprospiraceae bacterium]|nr:hypothetical protein [Saprospiraceae bacterium]
MSYLGFGISDPRGLGTPRKAFKPIFEQLYNGEHPTTFSENTNPDESWTEKNEHLFAEQKRFNSLASKLPLITVFAGMAIAIIALV